MRSLKSFIRLAVTAGSMALLGAGLLGAQDVSHARIVRLSYVEGTVTLQRPEVPDWAAAPVNTPIQEGFKLSTAESSFAEVEFENGSTIRLGQLGLLEFSELALQENGAKINRVALLQGYATFHALPENGDDIYDVNTPQGRVSARGKSLFRVDLDENMERVEVFKGTVDVAGNLGAWSLRMNDVLELHPGEEDSYSLTQGITSDAWDEWVNERETVAHATPAGGSPSPRVYSNDVSDLLYGWNDLSNYGMWSNVQGYGYGWVPAVGPGWSPYSLGRWCWYPGFGWVWISSEPWGWLPYHYGGWDYIAGVGWAWFPDDFGAFAPAEVVWYTGPGWIGWTPKGSPLGPAATCPAGQSCGTAVSSTTFQNGITIAPSNHLPFDPFRGHRIAEPGLLPTHAATLPGPPAPRLGLRGRPGTEPPGGTRAVTLGAPGQGRATSGQGSTVVYDPAQGRYVNGPVIPRPAPATGNGGGEQPAPTTQKPSAQPAATARIAPAPIARPRQSTPPGTSLVFVSPGDSAGTGKAPSMGQPRDAAPRDTARPGPGSRDRSESSWNSGGSPRAGGSESSGAVKSGGGQMEGGGRSGGASMVGGSSRSSGGGGGTGGGGGSVRGGGGGSGPHSR